ncbi:MAG: dihydropteroate synthase [Candidatus Heimdallarchaeota archaeon]|nr:dihydropteroate synthase [Candidatus Heimdallarchaeota archaeon]
MKKITIDGLTIGPKEPVRIQGVINLSPESFYKGSIKTGPGNILQSAIKQVKEGADIIDIGAKSTAPYLVTEIPPEEEIERAVKGIKIIKKEITRPISIDTTNADVAKAAIEIGASMINDVTGFNVDPKMVEIVADFKVPVIIGATKINRFAGNPTERVIESLKHSLNMAKEAGIREDKIIVDPDIGFHRIEEFKWYKIDAHILMHLMDIIKACHQPLCIGLSRKSFIGKILDLKEAKDRLYGSLGATSIAVLHGANLIRTHDVRETVESIHIIEKIIEYGSEI